MSGPVGAPRPVSTPLPAKPAVAPTVPALDMGMMPGIFSADWCGTAMPVTPVPKAPSSATLDGSDGWLTISPAATKQLAALSGKGSTPMELAIELS